MSEARADAEALRQLIPLWERLVATWAASSGKDLALNRLRADVIARFQSAASSLAGVWLNQALALAAWHTLANEIQHESITVMPYSEWDALRDLAEQLQRRVEEEQRAA